MKWRKGLAKNNDNPTPLIKKISNLAINAKQKKKIRWYKMKRRKGLTKKSHTTYQEIQQHSHQMKTIEEETLLGDCS